MTVSRVKLSPQGPEFSRFIAGFWRAMSWQKSPQDLLAFIEQNVELGVTTMDHADIYSDGECEKAFGAAIKLQPGLRDKIEIVSKCGIKPAFDTRPERYVNHYDTSKEHIIASAEQSLLNLEVESLDMLLIHRPDPLMDAEQVAAAFSLLQQQGKVKHFGVSNFTNSQFELLQSACEMPLLTNQIEISPVNISALHDGSLDYCQQHKVSAMAWSCLAGGEIFTGESEQAQRLREVLIKVAAEIGAANIDQVIYAWILALPAQVLPIIGSGRIERTRSTVATEALQLDRQQWFSIWQASTGHSVP
ncbi:aldo/keto reductase [Motilimonas pumila]|uniref:Aldo/keto reductase family oxidoreductase n=1 Tax=Motilimonas pumila TaxID=2303987 RepID=A0A418YHN4_9GAMM|nr:aldo/keto reductase family oxidoreductase [Motilimonas pumila]RJG49564.1 aldo/keto reductase family oxidoreductase [Motilimonas pumila]